MLNKTISIPRALGKPKGFAEKRIIEKSKILIVVKKINEIKYYYKPIFEGMERKLELAKELSKSDKELGLLIPLVLIEGLATIKYPNIPSSSERYKEFLKNYGNHKWLSEKANRAFLYSTFRCSLAHMGMIDDLLSKIT